jgi:hypothetical protein
MPATYREELCPKCGAQVYDNTENKRNPKAPDYKCSDKDCDYVKWPPRGGSRRNATPPPQRRSAAPPPSQRNGNDDRSNRIERQHSQEMALRLAAIDNTAVITDGKFDMKKLKWFIDWFQRDVAKLPLNAPIQRQPEPEPEPEPGYEPTGHPEDDEIPF